MNEKGRDVHSSLIYPGLPTSHVFERFYTTLQCTKPGSPLLTTAHEPNLVHKAISSNPRKHFVINENICYIYEKLVDLVKCNISRNNHIT